MTLAPESFSLVRLLANAVPAARPTKTRSRPLPTRRPTKALRALASEARRRQAAFAAVLARPRVAHRLKAVAAGEVADAGAAAATSDTRGARAGVNAAAAVEAQVVVTWQLLRRRRRRAATVESHLSGAVQHPFNLHHFERYVFVPDTFQGQLEEQALSAVAGDLPEFQNVEVGLDESEGFRPGCCRELAESPSLHGKLVWVLHFQKGVAALLLQFTLVQWHRDPDVVRCWASYSTP